MSCPYEWGLQYLSFCIKVQHTGHISPVLLIKTRSACTFNKSCVYCYVCITCHMYTVTEALVPASGFFKVR